MKQNEQNFFSALEDIFAGAGIEGDSGYVNLLAIKHAYYRLILEKLRKDMKED